MVPDAGNAIILNGVKVLSIIIAILLFSVIVLFHEFGHFLLAKKCGVEVLEFSLGFGPRLLSHVWGRTRYSIKLLPLGGSCMMKGEDLEDYSEGSFYGKSVWQRMLVIAAGPVFNFILAWFFSVILVLNAGVDHPVVLGVSEGGAAAQAGIEAGDMITGINGKKILLFREISDYVYYHQDRLGSGEPVKVTWEHEGEKKQADLIPEKADDGRYILGINGSSNYRYRVSVPKALYYALAENRYWISMTFDSLRMLFTGQAAVSDLSGPIGVVEAISDTVEETKSDGAFYVFLNMLSMAVLLSANLGVINLLPIPALDGGRLLLLLVEAVRRKRNNPQIEMRITFAGIIFLLLLIAVVMFNDIRRLIMP